MNSALDLKGRTLAETLHELQAQVRKNPGDGKLRTFLFQLLAVMGNWERALAQLKVAGELDPLAMAMVQMYSAALQCEALRAEVFEGKRSPVVFGDPEPWVAHVLEALKMSAAGQHAKAAELRAEGFDAAPATTGHMVTVHDEPQGDEPPAGRAFEWIADADSRLGPMLEAVVMGRYLWIPLHRIRSIRIEEPSDLRDMIWAPAQFQWANGGEAVGVVPTRYAGTEICDDDALQLARRTDWLEVAEGTYHGLGQRMFATDTDDYPLLEVRQISLETAAAGS